MPDLIRHPVAARLRGGHRQGDDRKRLGAEELPDVVRGEGLGEGAGAVAGEQPLQIASIVKVTQNALLGIVAVLLTLYFSFKVAPAAGRAVAGGHEPAVEQTAVNTGLVIHMGKGFRGSNGTVGHELGGLIADACRRRHLHRRRCGSRR